MSGRPCAGPAAAVGKCNEHECGQVSVKTVAAVHRLLADKPYNIVAKVGDRLIMSCDPSTVDAVKVDSPTAKFGWLHNGKQILTVTKDDNCTLDSGVYAFVALPPEAQRLVLKLVAVSINNKPLTVYIKDKVQVWCNAVTLGYVFNRLSQEWIVNDTYVIKNYGLNSLASIDADTITIENLNFQGVWKCVITSTEINSTWVTSSMEIKVIGISTAWTRIMQDPIIRIIFTKNSSPKMIVLICSVFILTLCLSTWGCSCVVNRWRKKLTKKDPKLTHKNISYKRLLK